MRRNGPEGQPQKTSFSVHDERALSATRLFKGTRSGKVTERPKHGSINDDGSDIRPRDEKKTSGVKPRVPVRQHLEEGLSVPHKPLQGDIQPQRSPGRVMVYEDKQLVQKIGPLSVLSNLLGRVNPDEETVDVEALSYIEPITQVVSLEDLAARESGRSADEKEDRIDYSEILADRRE